MRIFDVGVYRDGGSIELSIEKDGVVRHVWLDTPFKGEPRALLVDSVSLNRNDPTVIELLSDIENWWSQLDSVTQLRVQEVRKHNGPYYNPSVDVSEAIELSRVLDVRDYVFENYIS